MEKKYNTDVMRKLQKEHDVSMVFVYQALKGTRKSDLAIQIKADYDYLLEKVNGTIEEFKVN